MKKVVEIFTFKLAAGNTEADFTAAGEQLNGWMRVQPGFESSLMSRDNDGLWRDVYIWNSAREAKQASDKFMREVGDSDYMKMIDLATISRFYGELEQVTCG
ncbi:MAG: hypothetical protein WC007_05530 [Pelobacteraceae bacterium]